jgi:hypothetical protein
MAQTCERHSFELSAGMCRTCGHWFCAQCLVFAFGDKKPPFCVQCALAAAGVRSTAGLTPRVAPKEVKRELKAWRKAQRKDKDAVRPGSEAEATPADKFGDEVDAWNTGEEIWEDTLKR